jgi:hypothetical protein
VYICDLFWIFCWRHSIHAVVPPASVDALSPTNTMKPTKKVSTTFIAIGRALQQSSYNASLKLNLQTDFDNPTTGLHSEGGTMPSWEWLRSNKRVQRNTLQLADSLYAHSWDGISFRRRTWSGNWDHSTLLDNSSNPPEQANYYRERPSEYGCV